MAVGSQALLTAGTLAQDLGQMDVLAVTFLDERHLLLCVYSKIAAELVVYRFGEEIGSVLRLTLPPLRPWSDGQLLARFSNGYKNVLTSKTAQLNRFRPSGDESVISLTLDGALDADDGIDGYEWSMLLVFPRSEVLDGARDHNLGREPEVKQWGSWLQCCVPLDVRFLNPWAYGTRLAITSTYAHELQVFDFAGHWEKGNLGVRDGLVGVGILR